MQKRKLGNSGLEENIGVVTVELISNALCEIENGASKISVRATRHPETLRD